MMEPSRLCQIANIVMGQSPAQEYVSEKRTGLPLLNGPSEFDVSHPIPKQWTTNPARVARNGDLLFCVRGSTTGRMNWADQDYAIGRGLAAIQPHEPETAMVVRAIIEFNLPGLLKAATGSTFPNVSRDQLRNLLIKIGEDVSLKAVARIASAIDDRLEISRGIATTLEKTARALFRSWFVDFDPVHAKAEGRETGLPADIADLFPDAFDADGLPNGWQLTPAGDLAELVRDGVEPSELDPLSPYVGLDSMPKRQLGLTDWGKASEVTSVKIRFSPGDLLFGKLRPYFHKVVIAPLDGICSSDIFVFRPKGVERRHFMYLAFSQDDFVEAASGASTGTHMPRADWKFMRGIEFASAPAQLMAAFENIAASLIKPVVKQHGETHVLTELRDTLLPKLISGELRIPEAEEAVAAA